MGSDKKKKKHKHKRKEHKEKHKARKSKKHEKHRRERSKDNETSVSQPAATSNPPQAESGEDFAIPIALMNSKSHAPETPEEYQRRQSQIRREVDPVTGRIRLIKGDSEILEEIVSKDRHTDINKKATKSDGEYYEAHSLGSARRQAKPK